ncbi:MAG TPA: DUF2231 domain-containing protein [Abditibacteriaceae bacterium]|jgi:uncharacterized membrane protein
MESKAKFLGHPAHIILIVFPLGLLSTAAIFDLLALAKKKENKKRKFAEAAYLLIGAGILGGLVAAPFGTIDWLAIPQGTRAKRVGAAHGLGNVAALGLFTASWFLRRKEPQHPTTPALTLSFTAAALSGVTGWLGSELVERLGVGVYPGAHLDSPNTLSGRPATEDENDD